MFIAPPLSKASEAESNPTTSRKEGGRKMKKVGLVSLVFMLGLLFSVSSHAGPIVNPGTYSTANGDFTAKLWKEIFFGCSASEPFSVLKVLGEGFALKRAVLESNDPINDPEWQWMSTYQCGTLILNSKGPWLKRGRLVAKHLTVHKYSTVDENNNLKFRIISSGLFENTSYRFTLEITFEGTPETYEARYDEDDFPEFQMGSHMDIVIRIYKTSPPV
jgi:hypothetical protein